MELSGLGLRLLGYLASVTTLVQASYPIQRGVGTATSSQTQKPFILNSRTPSRYPSDKRTDVGLPTLSFLFCILCFSSMNTVEGVSSQALQPLEIPHEFNHQV
jgi:hypothetical protein